MAEPTRAEIVQYVTMSRAPWTEDQVASLNGYQAAGWLHPFTHGNGESLVATSAGWVKHDGGPVVQDWAHPFMLDWTWKAEKPSWLP